MKGLVFIDGYGLVKFRANVATRLITGDPFEEEEQFKGEIKWPKGVTDGYGKKWTEYDKWFIKSEIHKSAKKAILSQKWHKF